MIHPLRLLLRFFKVAVHPRAYLNLAYLLAAFPLGVFYFVFLSIFWDTI